MSKEEEKEALLATAKFQTIDPLAGRTGGQNCGVIPKAIRLTSEESNFEITINAYRSQLANKQLAYLLFQLYIDEITK